MREIKFRIWNRNQQKMLTHEQMARSNVFALQDGLEPSDFIVLPKHDFWKLMQYTGLKDKNGVEIYEGDIVTCICLQDWPQNRLTCVVRWHDKEPLLGISEIDSKNPVAGVGNFTFIDEIEIIGNIHESPELTK